ncbi:TPA: hypothetical protein EYP45_02445, partial [Candidatus Peregrinibacteria bacterium]|nr:hypothetical protein [Candidatus Peregrinibacteria bacterium]
MALADIIQLVSFEKDAKIARMKESQEKDIKILLEEATARGEKYSIQKFEEFEIFQKALEKRTDSDIVRNEKIKTAEFIKKISEEVFFALKKEIMSLSEKDQITFFANEIAKISDTKGDILARGTSVSVLEKAVKQALTEGKLVIFDIDVQGHEIVKEQFDDILTSLF